MPSSLSISNATWGQLGFSLAESVFVAELPEDATEARETEELQEYFSET
jgi:hypothetical protein